MIFKIFGYDFELTKKYTEKCIGPVRLGCSLQYQKHDTWYWTLVVTHNESDFKYGRVLARIVSPEEKEPELTDSIIKDIKHNISILENNILDRLKLVQNLLIQLENRV